MGVLPPTNKKKKTPKSSTPEPPPPKKPEKPTPPKLPVVEKTNTIGKFSSCWNEEMFSDLKIIFPRLTSISPFSSPH